ncbi:hypothetical protein J7K27_10110 [Candidatus Bathyarchaeota archaeon]|nr:hypothetical protein [Candidatus Bathyarchaeota archaeon]
MPKRIWVSKSVYEMLQRRAEAEGLTVEQFVDRLMQQFIQEIEQGKLSILEG